jgi:membrane associated rhomboid family serine protease
MFMRTPMRDLIMIAVGAALAALALAALGLNRARTPNAAYSAAMLGVAGGCILASALAALYVSTLSSRLSIP